jgi:hypothetical protein
LAAEIARSKVRRERLALLADRAAGDVIVLHDE